MKQLIDPVIKQISEIKDKKQLAKLIVNLIKSKADMQYIRTAFNKFLYL